MNLSLPQIPVPLPSAPPTFSTKQVEEVSRTLYGIDGKAEPLASYVDQNFKIVATDGSDYVLKIANASEAKSALALHNAAMTRVNERFPGLSPVVVSSVSGKGIETATNASGQEHFVRLLTFLPEALLHRHSGLDLETWHSLGDLLAKVDEALADLDQEAAQAWLPWDLQTAAWTVTESARFGNGERRALVQRTQLQFEAIVAPRLAELPKSVIHGDANDQNLVVDRDGKTVRVVGLFDFGDVVYTARIFELAIAAAYVAGVPQDPVAMLEAMVRGYHARIALSPTEIEVLLPALCMRLVVSVTVSNITAGTDPDNSYAVSCEDDAWKTLERLMGLDPESIRDRLLGACGHIVAEKPPGLPQAEVVEKRSKHLGPSLSLSYRDPLEIMRGRGQFLFDKTGRAFLDCVNNVCHVGHCHPVVVEAAQRQIGELNTNTRYLHNHVAELAERLTNLFPDPLSVCFFTNSGSEANELAVRMAREVTGRRGMVTVSGGYHGNTSTLVDLSPYKHDGPGGKGAPEWLKTVDCPDTYRGRFREDDAGAGERYAAQVARATEEGDIAAFLVEPMIGCGGQIIPPKGYLRLAFQHAHNAGALCIADEVQIGFGRVGSHWWGFERDDALPDIVTLGKPMGNGHPLAAVVTTPEIAAEFDNGMEYFNTFGGNPVSCAIGLAVLNVIETEDLRQNAVVVGEHLLSGFRQLAEKHNCIGDVRGAGFYLGVEFVKDRLTKEPAPELLARTIECARSIGVLLSSDGPDHNVLKIKPPMVFSTTDAELMLAVLDRAISAPY